MQVSVRRNTAVAVLISVALLIGVFLVVATHSSNWWSSANVAERLVVAAEAGLVSEGLGTGLEHWSKVNEVREVFTGELPWTLEVDGDKMIMHKFPHQGDIKFLTTTDVNVVMSDGSRRSFDKTSLVDSERVAFQGKYIDEIIFRRGELFFNWSGEKEISVTCIRDAFGLNEGLAIVLPNVCRAVLADNEVADRLSEKVLLRLSRLSYLELADAVFAGEPPESIRRKSEDELVDDVAAVATILMRANLPTPTSTVSFVRGRGYRAFYWDRHKQFQGVVVYGDGLAFHLSAPNAETFLALSRGLLPPFVDGISQKKEADPGTLVHDQQSGKAASLTEERLRKPCFKSLVNKLAYDARGRRIQQVDDTAVEADVERRFFHTLNWQIAEGQAGTGNSGTTPNQVDRAYVWSPMYIDAMVLRDRDSDGNGSFDERIYPQFDANFNVTSLTDGNSGSMTLGDVLERYVYDPYSTPAV